MKWYKHISDSLTDPFISRLMEEFGPLGYLVFFGVLEIYAREFKTDPGWTLKLSRRYLARMLNLSRSDLALKCLRLIRESGKWVVTLSGKGDKDIEIFIPKFRELMSDATLKKLRKEQDDDSGHRTDTKRLRDADAEEEEDKSVSPNGDTSPAVADDAPAATKSGSNGKGKARPGPPPCPHEEIIALYHEVLPELPRVKIWNKTRRRYLQARWREDPERQNLDWWLRYFEQVRASPFLMGQVTGREGRPFMADLEWLIRPRNMPKVLEGRYLDTRPPAAKEAETHASQYDEL